MNIDGTAKTLVVPLSPSTAHTDDSWAHHLKDQGVEDVDSQIIQEVLSAFQKTHLAFAKAHDLLSPRQQAYEAAANGTTTDSAAPIPDQFKELIQKLRDEQ